MLQTRLSEIRVRWQDLMDGFWFVPGLISGGIAVLALIFLGFDHLHGESDLPFLFSGNSSAASGILSAISASFIAALGLSFSIMIVTFQLVTSQFTPRGLRGLLSDRVTQSISGYFVGIFAYALIVLAAVRDPAPNHPGFVPALSISLAILLAFVGLILLIIFFHHIAGSMHIYNITARISRETLEALDDMYPAWSNDATQQEDGAQLLAQWQQEGDPDLIYATHNGYVQTIDFDGLLHAFSRIGPGVRLQLAVCPGEFVSKESVIARVWSPRNLEDAAVEVLRRCVVVLKQRDMEQDPAFGIRQLTDIALRAMSPAVNDPSTAVNCIHYLQAIFEHLAHCGPAPSVRHLGGSIVVIRYLTFQEYVQVLVEIGRVTTTNARVARALLRALASLIDIAAHTAQERIPYLLEIADAIVMPALADARTDLDRQILNEAYQPIQEIAQKLKALPDASSGAARKEITH
ncbi:hypothetical protein KDA_71830 [Dictyobacter alpinus]|uniref:DUF2254 domain-containing protein n=1 Tax=Dictyobacter alpinus TaxID=2014873 RepID=A0A402BK23_9CHLR|nr:DUF2254 domain-containing protein [Dictyobacter alpinus]GCE31699.1 hypothetical protein KDA_71830 [Dictyobacter alpinus]